MDQHHIIDTANMPWKRGVSEGIGYECQVLLTGHDGRPEALRFRIDEARPSIRPCIASGSFSCLNGAEFALYRLAAQINSSLADFSRL